MISIRWKALTKTKDIIIYTLRQYLSNKDNYINLIPTQLEEDHYVKTAVYDIEPEELREFPLIIITGSSGSMVTSSINDVATEVYDPMTGDVKAYRYGGMYEFNITIEIGTKSTLDREVLTDLVTIALRLLLRKRIQEKGIIIKSMSYGGESVIQYDSNHIYVSTINLSTWSEWYEDIELLPNNDTIDFDVILKQNI